MSGIDEPAVVGISVIELPCNAELVTSVVEVLLLMSMLPIGPNAEPARAERNETAFGVKRCAIVLAEERLEP